LSFLDKGAKKNIKGWNKQLVRIKNLLYNSPLPTKLLIL